MNTNETPRSNEKIIEHIERDTGDAISSGISISTIAALDLVETCPNNFRLEVSIPTDTNNPPTNFVSKSIEWSTLLSKLTATANTFDGEYSQARQDVAGADIYTYMRNQAWKWGSFPNPSGSAGVEPKPCVWNDVWTLCHGTLQLKDEVDDVKEQIANINDSKPAYSPEMTFSTTLSVVTENGERVAKDYTTPMSKAYQDPASGVNSDGFVLSFNQGDRVTNTLTCKADGMLVLYGWVDSSNVANVKYLPTCWCALEGNLSGSWEILNVQSVMPAKQFSYVGFSVPVIKGLKVRCELGFIPGEASGRYDRTVAPSSLSNVRPNAFLGGVFSMKPTTAG